MRDLFRRLKTAYLYAEVAPVAATNDGRPSVIPGPHRTNTHSADAPVTETVRHRESQTHTRMHARRHNTHTHTHTHTHPSSNPEYRLPSLSSAGYLDRESASARVCGWVSEREAGRAGRQAGRQADRQAGRHKHTHAPGIRPVAFDWGGVFHHHNVAQQRRPLKRQAAAGNWWLRRPQTRGRDILRGQTSAIQAQAHRYVCSHHQLTLRRHP